MSTTNGVDLSLSGLASGFDWKTLVSQLADVERAPQTDLRNEKSTINQQNSAWGNIKSLLSTLQTRVDALKDPVLYTSRTSQAADTSVVNASVRDGAPLGTYQIAVSQLATAARQTGKLDIGNALSATSDVSGLVVSDAPLATPIVAGTFTVNGQQVNVATTDTLKQVFDKISAATNGAVTASYDPTADAIVLTSASAIMLGSSTDTSNFLQATKLYDNGLNTITSGGRLGAARVTGALNTANLANMSDGGSGAGVFKINGVTINFSASSDSLQNVMDRINASSAGVTASYDTVNDRIVLTSKSTGDMGIALQDVTGTFLAATGISSGTFVRGKNLLYTINNGDQMVSQSNTISSANSGISGLTVTALKEASTTIAVSSDTGKITTAINNFISAFNQAQSFIDSQTASTTDANGKVSAGIFAGQRDVDDIASSLRTTVNAILSGAAGTLKSLDDLGIVSNGNDNTISLSDSSKLSNALANRLGDVQSFFADSTHGIALALDSYLTRTIGDDGTLVTQQANLTKRSSGIDTQIADLEKRVQADSERMTAQFIAMETARSRLNQQLQYLVSQFSGSSSSK